MTRARTIPGATLIVACLGGAAGANAAGDGKTSHEYWPSRDGVLRKAHDGDVRYTGTSHSDELLGHHGSDDVRGGGGSDVLWGDCGPGRDIYHVARSRKGMYRFLNCERSTTGPRAYAAARSSRSPSGCTRVWRWQRTQRR